MQNLVEMTVQAIERTEDDHTTNDASIKSLSSNYASDIPNSISYLVDERK